MDHPILNNPKEAVNNFVDRLQEDYDSVSMRDYGNGWFNVTIQTEKDEVIYLTFLLHAKWSAKFENNQIFADTSLDVVTPGEHPVSVHSDVRLGSDPGNLGYLDLKIENWIDVARSPQIVVEDTADITNAHGESHLGTEKHLVNSTRAAEDIDPFWKDLPEDATVQSSNRDLRALNEWEEEVYHA
jgi:hypothetical protein